MSNNNSKGRTIVLLPLSTWHFAKLPHSHLGCWEPPMGTPQPPALHGGFTSQDMSTSFLLGGAQVVPKRFSWFARVAPTNQRQRMTAKGHKG